MGAPVCFRNGPLNVKILVNVSFIVALVVLHTSSHLGEAKALDLTRELWSANKTVSWPQPYRIIHQTAPPGVHPQYMERTIMLSSTWSYRYWPDKFIQQWLQSISHEYHSAFKRGKSKWKADLFRIILLAKQGGMFLDSDIMLLRPLSEVFNKPDVDFYGLVGPFGEIPGRSQLHIGFMAAKSPEPVLEQWLSIGSPNLIAHPKRYAYNIEGIYQLFSKKFFGSASSSSKEIPPLMTNQKLEHKGRTYFFFQEKIIDGIAYGVDEYGVPFACTNYCGKMKQGAATSEK